MNRCLIRIITFTILILYSSLPARPYMPPHWAEIILAIVFVLIGIIIVPVIKIARSRKSTEQFTFHEIRNIGFGLMIYAIGQEIFKYLFKNLS